MDLGHHNCRDYYFLKPTSADEAQAQAQAQAAPASIPTASILAIRAASKTPSQKSPLNGPSRRPSAFRFLHLPYELRQHVYSYLLPSTDEHTDTRHLLQSISAKRTPPTHTNLTPVALQALLQQQLQKQQQQQQQSATSVSPGSTSRNIIWRRGNTSLLAVCKQLHAECAALLYGENTFVIFVAYDTITFRFRWLLPNGLTPSRTYEFLDLVPPRYLKLIRRLLVTVDHVDSYTGMIKYNVGGKGLAFGLQGQMRTLVTAFLTPESPQNPGAKTRNSHNVKRISVKLLNGNDHLDTEKRNVVKARETSIRGVDQVQTVLEPLNELRDVVQVEITGAVTDEYAHYLTGAMMARS